MKILLLGAGGQVGHELSPLLAARGELVAPTRTQVDVTDLGALKALVDRERPHVIVNGTAYNEVDRAEAEPEAAHRINAEAVVVLGDYATREGAALIHYSTDFVFDGKGAVPYVETDATQPLSVYGRSKLAGEKALEEMRAPAIVLRTAWLYSLRRKSFVSQVLKLARERQELSVVTDQVGSPTWCRDLARVTAEIIDRLGSHAGDVAAEHRGVYHAAGKGHCSRFDLARAVIEGDVNRTEHVVKKVLPVTADAFPAPAARPAFAPLDGSKLERHFGVAFEPWQTALESALRSPASPV
jgi:dTDP-4-dehydrorhamnose reductase